ncbi:hypothetical protein [Aquimarina aquimarini]|nr:hypothetical protein [Aquimarina aquimarini]
MKAFILIWSILIMQLSVYAQKSVGELDILFEEAIKKRCPWNVSWYY